ncbi:hypothetical protein GCM10017691_26350 [Pseudonocardia petroleophila]
MAGHWVELRVHGVRATDPEDMLDVDRVVQVAGDELGRVFRRADRRGVELPEADGHVVEAYHWGRLTSGSFGQALWLLLAPFGLVNAAQFTLPRPRTPGERRWHELAGAALRLLGLALTALFVLTVATMTVDLWAWQQARATGGGAYALALLAPVALLAAYRWAAGPPAPDVREAAGTDGPASPDDERPSALVRHDFFVGVRDLRSLQALHVAGGLAVVAGVGAGLTGSAGFPQVLRAAAAVLFGLVAVTVTVGLRDLDTATNPWAPADVAAARRRSRNRELVAQVLAVLGGAVALVTVGAALLQPVGGGPGGLPGSDVVPVLVMLVAVLAVAVLAVANALLARTHRAEGPFAPYAGGRAATLLALLGLFLGVGYSGAFTTVVAAALTSPERPVVVPELLSRVAYAWGITAVGVVLLAGYLLLRRRAAVAAVAPRVAVSCPWLTGRWTRTVAAAMWTARVKNGLVCVLTTFGVLGVVLTVVAAIDLAPVLGLPAVALPWVLDVLSWWPRPGVAAPAFQVALLAFGTLTLTALATGLILLARTALFGAAARRGINVVWDVIAFWPRAVHPFVPSAYSARAVADLEDRIRWHLRDAGAARLAVCGHSQGSLLTFAALVRLAASAADRALLERIAYLTFGSQLQVMFARGFPAYVNLDAVTALHSDLRGNWRNLYRDTDALAGPVLSWNRGAPQWVGDLGRVSSPAREQYGPDWRLADPPPPADRTLQRACLLPLRGHGEYWLDPAWYDALAGMGCSREVPEGLPARQRGEPGVVVDEPADPVGIDAGVLAQSPADALAQEEVRVVEGGLDDVDEEREVDGLARVELGDDRRAAQPAVGVGGPGAQQWGQWRGVGAQQRTDPS